MTAPQRTSPDPRDGADRAEDAAGSDAGSPGGGAEGRVSSFVSELGNARGPRHPASGAGASGTSGDEDLPEETARLLGDFASALQRFAMYPAGHPALEGGARDFLASLRAAFETRSHLTVTSRKRRVWVDGAASEPDHPLLSSLAERLHDHQVLSVTLRKGIEESELASFLARLSRDADGESGPLGTAGLEVWGSWSHVNVEPVRYDPLQVGRRDAGMDAEDVWMDDARDAFDTDIGGVDFLENSPEVMARSIETQLGDETRDRMIAVQLFRLAQQLAKARGRDAARLRRQMSETILQLDPESLKYLLELGQEGEREDSFLADAAEAMDAQAVVELVKSAAEHRKKDVASPLLRLMTKMAMYAEGDGAPRPEEQGAVRNLVESMVDDWRLEDPNPRAYDTFLDQMAHSAPKGGVPTMRDSGVEPDRMVKMGLELEEYSQVVEEAAAGMIRQGSYEELADLMESVEEENAVAARLWDQLGRPEVVRELLAYDPPALELIERIVDRVGVQVAEPLLDALCYSNSRPLRRSVFNLLTDVGAPVAPMAAERLDDVTWYVRRNMLALLAELPERPEGFSALEHMDADDPRVRAEALKVVLKDPEEREIGLVTGLEDPDDRVVSLALAAAERSCPDAAEEPLVRVARDRGRPYSLRVHAVRALEDRQTDRALEALMDLTWVRRWIFFRRLADPSPVTREAVRVLARRWIHREEAEVVVRAAAEAEDDAMREAAADALAAADGAGQVADDSGDEAAGGSSADEGERPTLTTADDRGAPRSSS